MLRITDNNFVSKPGFNAEVTRRLQTVNRNAAPNTLPQNVKATNSTRAQLHLRRHLCPLCSFVARRTPPWATPGARARNHENQLTGGENCRMCVNTHIRKKVHIGVSRSLDRTQFRYASVSALMIA